MRITTRSPLREGRGDAIHDGPRPRTRVRIGHPQLAPSAAVQPVTLNSDKHRGALRVATVVGAIVNPTSSPTHRRVPRAAAGALLASLLLLVPAPAHAQETPPPPPRLDIRFDLEVGPFGLLDAGAVNRELARAGYSALPHLGAIYGGRFALEHRRVHVATGLFATRFPSTSTTFDQRLGFLDVGYRVLGRPSSWGIIPFVGLGAAESTLTAGPPTTPGARTFAQALQGRNLQELQASSLLLHTGVLVDVLRAYDARSQRGVALGASAGFVGAPLSTAWAPMAATAAGNTVSGGPHVPGTGAYGTVRFTLSF